jgi:hypothetical protein
MKKTEQRDKQLELFFNYDDMTVIELALTTLAHTATELMIPQAEGINDLLTRVENALNALQEEHQ